MRKFAPHIGRDTAWSRIAPIADKAHEAMHRLLEEPDSEELLAEAHSAIVALKKVGKSIHENRRDLLDRNLPDSESGVTLGAEDDGLPEVVVLSRNAVNLVDGELPKVWIRLGEGSRPVKDFFNQLLDAEFIDEHNGPFEPWYHLALVKGMETRLSEVKPFQSVDMQPPGRFELNDVEFPVFVEELHSGLRLQIHKCRGEVRVFRPPRHSVGDNTWRPYWRLPVAETAVSFQKMECPEVGIWDGILSGKQFHVFDMFYEDGMPLVDLPLFERKEHLHTCKFAGNVSIIPSRTVSSEDEIHEDRCIVKPVHGTIRIGERPEWYVRRAIRNEQTIAEISEGTAQSGTDDLAQDVQRGDQ